MSVTSQIADGLDASTDGRGFDINHLKAFRLADASPDLVRALEEMMRLAGTMEDALRDAGMMDKKFAKYANRAHAQARFALQASVNGYSKGDKKLCGFCRAPLNKDSVHSVNCPRPDGA